MWFRGVRVCECVSFSTMQLAKPFMARLSGRNIFGIPISSYSKRI